MTRDEVEHILNLIDISSEEEAEAIEVAIKVLEKSKWHKVSEEGNPTEEGYYLVAVKLDYQEEILYETDYFETVDNKNEWFNWKDSVVAWQKIQPFKESEVDK